MTLIRITPLLFIVLLCATVSIAQPSADSARIFAWLTKADNAVFNTKLDSGLYYSNLALQLSKEKKLLRGEGFAKLRIADIWVQQSHPGNVTELFADGLKIGTQLKDSFLMALACYQHGQYLMYNNDYDSAEKLYNKALMLQFEKAQSSYTAVLYNDMGYLFGLKGELEKQVYWLLKARRVYEKVEDADGLALTTNNLAGVYASLKDAPKAFQYIMEAIAIRKKIGDIRGLAFSYGNLSRWYREQSLDSAIKYQEIATQYAEKTGVQKIMAGGYDNLSVLLDMQRKKAEALEYIKKSIAISREMGDTIAMADKMRWAAILSGDLKDTVTMNDYFNQVYNVAIRSNNKTLLRDFFGSKASYYKKTNDYRSAYDNLKQYYAYRDSIVSEATTTNIAELQTKYETEKKDNEISRLNTDQKIKQLQIEKQRATISGNALEARQKENEIKLLSQQQQLRDAKISQQAEELEKQLLVAKTNQQELKLAEQEKQLSSRQLQNQKLFRNVMIAGILLLIGMAAVLFNRYQLKKKLEQQQALLQVRNNIARDLHDEIGSTLTSINILSQVSHSNLQKDQRKASTLLEKITEQSSQIQQGMSDIVWAIAPDNDKLGNMVARMREYATHTLESKDVLTYFEVDEKALSKSIGMEQRRDFFLIFKEAINNVAKYAGAQRVNIRLCSLQDRLTLEITDDGKGFDLLQSRSTNGLKNMRSRAEALHGNIDIQSNAGRGTFIKLDIPAT